MDYKALGRKIKAQYPQYNNTDDEMLGIAVAQKFPQYEKQEEEEEENIFGFSTPSDSTLPPTETPPKPALDTFTDSTNGTSNRPDLSTFVVDDSTTNSEQKMFQQKWQAAPDVKTRNAIAETWQKAMGYSLYETPPDLKLTDAEKTKKNATIEAERIIALLEDQYFSGNNGKSLGYGKGSALQKKFEEWTSFGAEKPQELEEINAYNALRSSIKPKFVKAMGDSGNFSRSEQEAAVKDVPTEFNTRSEAIRFFSGLRDRFGLQKRDVNKIKPSLPTATNKGLPPIEKNNLNDIGKIRTFLSEVPEPIISSVKSGIPLTQVPERIKSYTLPETREYFGKALRGELAIQQKPETLPEKIAGLAGPIGTTLVRPDIGLETIGPATELAFVIETAQKIKDMIRPSKEVLGNLRKQAAEKFGDIPKKQLDRIIKAGDDYAKIDPSIKSEWAKQRASLLKKPSMDTLIKRYEVWNKAYKSLQNSIAPSIKDTAKASLYNKLKQEAEMVVDDIAPKIAQFGKEIGKIYASEANAQARKKLLSRLFWSFGPSIALLIGGKKILEAVGEGGD